MISIDVKSSGRWDGAVNGAWARTSKGVRRWLRALVKEVVEMRPAIPSEGVAITIRREP